MGSEVLREAARRRFSGNPQARRTRLTLTVQGWGMPETFQVADGFQSGEAAAMLHVVGEKTTMVEVHQRSEIDQEIARRSEIAQNSAVGRRGRAEGSQASIVSER